jgi:hypothetical protein
MGNCGSRQYQYQVALLDARLYIEIGVWVIARATVRISNNHAGWTQGTQSTLARS